MALLEYSGVFTDRSSNHMSVPAFQQVMRRHFHHPEERPTGGWGSRGTRGGNLWMESRKRGQFAQDQR